MHSLHALVKHVGVAILLLGEDCAVEVGLDPGAAVQGAQHVASMENLINQTLTVNVCNTSCQAIEALHFLTSAEPATTCRAAAC